MSIEAMKQALEALLDTNASGVPAAHNDSAIEALNQAIADFEKQEPYGWVSQHTTKGMYEWQFNKELSGVYKDTAISILPVYTDPQPKRECDMGVMCIECPDAQPKREPLTDEQILADETLRYHFGMNGGAGPVSRKGRAVIAAIEAAHGIKAD